MTKKDLIIMIVSIFASGFFSWLMTFIYFQKANRNAAISIVVEPFAVALCNNPVSETLVELYSIKENYEFRFLKKRERRAINDCVDALTSLLEYSEMYYYSIILKKHFFSFNKEKGFEIDEEQYYQNEEKTRFFTPYDYGDIEQSIVDLFEKNIDKYNMMFLNERCQVYFETKINHIFKHYSYLYFDVDYNYNYFENERLVDILNNDDLSNELYNRNEKYYNTIDRFNKIFQRITR